MSVSLKLIPPGKRGNRFWYLRGTVHGKPVEISTRCTNKRDAEAYKERNELRYRQQVTEPGSAITFTHAAERYQAYKRPKPYDQKRLADICRIIGGKFVGDITQDDIVHVADILFPRHTPATRNRSVVMPMAVVLHYAANNGWCDWRRVRKFKEPAPKTRCASPAHEEWLLLATKGDAERRLLLLWLFRQGDRISDVLRVRYEDCDLSAMTVRRHIAKTDSYRTMPLDDTLGRWLRWRVRAGHSGAIFTAWRDHHSVNHWLRRLCNRLEIHFTPHMARHTVGKRLSDSGASLRTIMAKLGHADPKSSLRYQAEDVEIVRAASRRSMGKNLG